MFLYFAMLMNTLFPVEPALPEGFLYIPKFINEAEEQQLLDSVTATARRTFVFQGYEAKRKVASFGQDWNFETQRLSKGRDIPDVYHWLVEKIAVKLGIPQERFAELLVTEYPVGSVINWHRDAPPFDVIAGISLLSDCTFRLRPYDKAKQNRGAVRSLPVKRRSLYIMQGAARTDWQHSIAPVKQVRYSITLRTLKTTTL